MPTQYDLFELMYRKGKVMKPKHVLLELANPAHEYHLIYNTILALEKEKHVLKKNGGYLAMHSKRNDRLYNLIRFCISNGINYNYLLDEKLARFIQKAIAKEEFSIQNFSLHPKTFAKYLDILSKSGLLIILSRKPLCATIPYNSFLADVLKYFGLSTSLPKKKEQDFAPQIGKELATFKRLLKKNERKYLHIQQKYEIRFIQHSLNLEGNPITLPETMKLLEEKIMPKDMKVETIQEVQNYKMAIEQMLFDSKEKTHLAIDLILKYHFLAMQHKPQIAGEIRKISVFIKNNPSFKVAKVEQVMPRLDALLNTYNAFLQKKHSIRELFHFSSYFHNEFQRIHPFIDGNSRTTRLLTFHILRSQGIPIMDIPLGLLEEYLSATKGAQRRNDSQLKRTLERIVLYNLKTINEQLKA